MIKNSLEKKLKKLREKGEAMDEKKLAKFFSEIFMLKRLQREGWRLAGLEESESLSEHITIAAQIAYILAELEGANPERAAVICLFHDNGECRIVDHHKVAARYLDTSKGEMQALFEQLDNLPKSLKARIWQLVQDQEKRKTKEGIIARDADWLEVALQAKIYIERGYPTASDWIKNVAKALETKSAKRILAYVRKQKDFTALWWPGLKKMTYKKLKKR